MNKLRITEYSSSLAAFGDPVLDELYRKSKLRPEPVVRQKTAHAEKCPGCGKSAILTRRYYALLCQECHDSITYLATHNLW